MRIMTYEEIRPFIREGDPLLTRDRGPVGGLIRLRTGGPVNHVAGKTLVESRHMLTQSTFFRGVHLLPVSEFLHRRKKSDVYWLPCDLTGEQREAFGAAMADTWGLDYESLKGMFGTATQNERLTRNSRWFCSELYKYAYETAGGELLVKPAGLTWPSDIWNAFGGEATAILIKG